MLTRRDLFIAGANLGIQWRFFTPEGVKLVAVGSTGALQFVKNSRRGQLQSLNPNYLHLISVKYYGANPLAYPEDWPYWLRDEVGNRIEDEGWNELLIDWTHPGAQDHFVEQAVAAAKCGIFDGILMDWWSEESQWDENMAALYHGSKVDGLVSLVKHIREAVGDDFLIIVNTNTRKVPRSAPFVNGAFMETIGPVKGYSRERLIEIEDALSWYEENFRYPQVNCLEGWSIEAETMDSPRNQQQARVFTTLSLTHSNGYVSYIKRKPIGGAGFQYWYAFWDVDLGRPIGEKGQLYENREGLFIRKYTNGWAVYNRSGKAQEISLPIQTTGVASGITSYKHTVPDLDGEMYLKTEVTADVNGDGVVNIQDLVIVANAFGKAEPDLNGDGVVNIQDLVIVANAF